MHGKHKDTHLTEEIFRCTDCDRTGWSDSFPKTFDLVGGRVRYCPLCNSRNVIKVEDEN